MGGTQTDGSGKHAVQQAGASGAASAVPPPVLGSVSDSELDAAISVLRTDKNLTLAPAPAPTARLGATTEHLLRSASRPHHSTALAAAREEAARHAWFVALGGRVVGPLELAALRSHWDQGELGPDSLCWREGFEGWQPVCHVTALSEVLAPSPQAPVSARHMVPVERTEAPGFQLKGAEALRGLSRATPPPLAPEVASELPPSLEPEPVTAPAAPALLDPVPLVHAVVDAAGAHPVVPAQVEVRIRGGMWLALGGGLVGGVLVALVLWGLGLSRGTGAAFPFHTGSPDAATPASTSTAVTSTPTPSPIPASVAGVPAVETSKSAGAVPRVALETSAASGGAPFFTVPWWNADVGVAAAAVPGPMTAMPTSPAPLAKPVPAPVEAATSTKPAAVAPRPVVAVPALRKQAKVDVALAQETPARAEPREDPAPANEEPDEDLGLDEDFARELDGPPNGAKAVARRTVWVPPEPTNTQTPASLTQSDIFAVVLANKGDVAGCVSAGKAPNAEQGKRVVVRWSIAPSGKVKDVVTETAEFQGTALAHCLETKIRSWTFPKHREQGGAVRFPFVF
jgi:hypothetical protein